MATVHIYQAQKLLDYKSFHSQFLILRDTDGQLIWQTYEERKRVSQKKGGDVQIWFRAVGGPDAYVDFPPANWRMWIDGVEWIRPQVIIPIAGKKVELRHGDYYFVFTIEGAA